MERTQEEHAAFRNRIATELLAAGQSPAQIIADLIIDTDVIDRMKSARAIEVVSDGQKKRLFEPGAPDARILWFQAEIMHALQYGRRYAWLDRNEMFAIVKVLLDQPQVTAASSSQMGED